MTSAESPDISPVCIPAKECGWLDAAAIGLPNTDLRYWCHRLKSHGGPHILGH